LGKEKNLIVLGIEPWIFQALAQAPHTHYANSAPIIIIIIIIIITIYYYLLLIFIIAYYYYYYFKFILAY